MSQNEEDEQSYYDLHLGKKPVLQGEIGHCNVCGEDVTEDEDYTLVATFKKVGNTGSTHTDFYHNRCLTKNG